MNIKYLASILVAMFLITGCEQDGPAEEFGENVDEAGENIRDAAEDAGDEIEEACEDATDEDC